MHNKRIKALIEKRDAVIEQMNSITAGAVDENGEERALTDEEQTQFDALEKQADSLNKSIKAESNYVKHIFRFKTHTFILHCFCFIAFVLIHIYELSFYIPINSHSIWH